MIKVAVFDVDGVFTDGTFYYNESGKILKKFGAHDADAIKYLKFNNVEVFAITADTRGFKISAARMDDLGIPLTIVTENDRLKFFLERFSFETTFFMGDGLHDAEILSKVKYSVCPKNGCELAISKASYVTNRHGGDGAVFEAVQWASASGYLQKTIEEYLDADK